MESGHLINNWKEFKQSLYKLTFLQVYAVSDNASVNKKDELLS